MHYQSVVDQVSLPIPLDPLAAMFFAACFVAIALATMRHASWGLAALLFASPFALYRDVLGTTVTLPKVLLLGTIVGLLTYRDTFAILRERRCAAILLALFAVSAATLLSILPAQHHGPVLREFFKSIEHIALVGTAYVAYRLDPRDTLLLRTFAFSVLLVVASALTQELTGAPSGLDLGGLIIPRIAGVLEGPNQLAAYLELAIAILGAWAIARPGRLTYVTLMLAAATAMLTFSRGGAVGILVVLVALAFVTKDRWFRVAIAILAGGLCGVALALALAVVGHNLRLTPQTSVAGLVARDSSYSGGVGNRAELWRAAWFLWRTHPWLGVGAGNYELDLESAGLFGVRTHANSWYLQALAEGGVVLLAATLGFILVTLRALGQHLREAPPWALGAFAATIALCIHQIVDYLIFYQKIGTPWMLAIGIGAAAIASYRRASRCA